MCFWVNSNIRRTILVVTRQLLHICYSKPMLQEGSMIVTDLCFYLNQTGVNTEQTIPVVTRGVKDCYTFVTPRGQSRGNANTIVISSLWNALRNVEHVIFHGVVTHLKWEILNLHVINSKVEASAL